MPVIEIANPTKFYRPRGAAKALFPCRDTEVLIEGPAGTGKTVAVLEKVNRWMLKCPGARALICRKTRASMTESVLVSFEARVLPNNPSLYPAVSDVQRRTRQSYAYPNGSVIVVGGLDNPDRIMSTEYDLIAVFEATETTEHDWETLLTRLRNGAMPFQQALADTNPSSPSHWLNRRASAGKMTRLLSRHDDNPLLYDESGLPTMKGQSYLDLLRTSLSGARALRLLSGKWAASEGLVYEDFDAAIHIIPAEALPAPAYHVFSVDWGFTNPGVIQVWAIDGDGRMYLRREVVKTKTVIGAWVEIAKGLCAEYPPQAVVCDPAEPSFISDFLANGIPAQPANNDIRPGVDRVQQRLKHAGDGRPRIFLVVGAMEERDPLMEQAKQPIGLAEEFDAYSWPKTTDGRTLKDKPMDKDNHSCDSARYAAAYVDQVGGQPAFDAGASLVGRYPYAF